MSETVDTNRRVIGEESLLLAFAEIIIGAALYWYGTYLAEGWDGLGYYLAAIAICGGLSGFGLFSAIRQIFTTCGTSGVSRWRGYVAMVMHCALMVPAPMSLWRMING